MGPVAPSSTVTSPPRDFGPEGAPTTYFWDPDIIAVDPSFNSLAQPNSAIQRLWTGALWAEGPAWNAEGRYLVWSDIPNNRQMRWIEDDGHVSRVSDAVEQQQRQHLRLPGPAALLRASGRRVVRYELDGSVTMVAEFLRGQAAQLTQRRRSPSRRQQLVHRPAIRRPDLRRRTRRGRGADQSRGQAQSPPRAACRHRHRVEARAADPDLPSGSGRNATVVATEEQAPDPNGLCFSPDYKRLYVASTGKGPGDTGPGGQGNVFVFDVNDDGTPRTTGSSPTAWSTA